MDRGGIGAILCLLVSDDCIRLPFSSSLLLPNHCSIQVLGVIGRTGSHSWRDLCSAIGASFQEVKAERNQDQWVENLPAIFALVEHCSRLVRDE